MNILPIKNALISVYDKTGLGELARHLKDHGVRLYSTGGTRAYLEKEIAASVESIESVTKFPEMLDGRVKTLHPKVFGGILARRQNADDLAQTQDFEIPLFDLIVVNFYPFGDHLGKQANEQSSWVDIGGPSMVRAAAKNFEAVVVLSDVSDYAEFLEELKVHSGKTSLEFRKKRAAQTFSRTSAYDARIASEWSEPKGFPTELSLKPQQTLRYGENPHQKAVWVKGKSGTWTVSQGKELSYNNLLDAEAATRLVAEFEEPSVVIVKHNNPCGVASANVPLEVLFSRAFQTDAKSAFGGIVAFNRSVDAITAEKMAAIFLEVVIAPGFDPKALEVFSKKKNLRLVEWKKPERTDFEIRAAMGGWLIQESDQQGTVREFKSVTKIPTDPSIVSDLQFAWRVCKHARSNAIVIAKGGVTFGIGAGQVSRVDAVELALRKSPKETGSVLASDAFFPFRDNIDLLRHSGVRAIIQPGGSQKDDEVIQACNELEIAMVFTGERHFRH